MGGGIITRLATKIPEKVIGMAYIAPSVSESKIKINEK